MGRKSDAVSGIEKKIVNEVYTLLSQQNPGTYFTKEGSFNDGNNSTRYVGVYRRLYGEECVNFFGRSLRLPITFELGNIPIFAVEISGDLSGRVNKFNPITDQKFYFSDVDLPPQIIDTLTTLNLKSTRNSRYYK